MNKTCFFGLGRVGKSFLKKILGQKKSNILLHSIIINKFDIKKKKYIEKKNVGIKKTFVSFNYKRFLKESSSVVELIGDVFFSKEIMLFSLLNKKKYVTANKKLIYKKNKLIRKFLYRNIFFESTVGASIPLVYSINSFFSLLNIKKIESILNGTTNYILSNSFKKRNSFKSLLLKSYKKGFSEKMPISDISGFDSFNKTFILVNLFFKKVLNFKCFFTGIKKVFSFKKVSLFLKKKIKLVSIIKIKKKIMCVEVCSFLVKKTDCLHNCKNIENIIRIKTFENEVFSLSGPGAGVETTSSSIYSDLLRKRSLFNTKKKSFFFLDLIKKKTFFLKNKVSINIFHFLYYKYSFKIFIFHKKSYIKSNNRINKKRILIILNFLKEKDSFLKTR
ncbi:Homoserine dehydrogenase [Candidatus Vidania fulgoroideae]|nr:Homoserine dehydrogenase [Candidatus Vidania fulgoroideae]